MLYNLDKYDIKLYNEFLNNLKNHNVNYNEFVSTKNYQFVLQTERYPEILDYYPLNKSQSLFLVAKVKAVIPTDEYLYRRKNLTNNKTNLNFCMNDAYNYFNDIKTEEPYFYFINIQNKERAEKLSSEIGRIYYMGKYVNNRYSVFLTNNQYIGTIISIDDILASGSNLFEAELQLNYECFRLQDRLKKFSMTPYYENGKQFLPKTLHSFFKSNPAEFKRNNKLKN